MLRRPSVRPSVRPSSVPPSIRRPPFSKIFSSETAWPIKAKFYMKHLWEGGTNVYINNPGHMTKMAAMPIYGKNLVKNLLLRNHWTNFNQTWHEALMAQALQCVYKSWPYDDLDLFYGKVNIGRECIRKGKIVKLSFKGIILQKMSSRTEY